MTRWLLLAVFWGALFTLPLPVNLLVAAAAAVLERDALTHA